MCGDWCYTVRRATPCGLRDGLAAQGRGDRVARFEFSGSLPDEIAGKTRVSCLPPPPPPAFCRRADRAKGKGGPEDDKETVRQVANRLFCSPAVRDRRRTGDSRRMGDFVGQFRARAGRRDARTPPPPATPVRLPFRSRRPVWLGRRPAGRRPHRAGAASDRPCRSGPRSRTSA